MTGTQKAIVGILALLTVFVCGILVALVGQEVIVAVMWTPIPTSVQTPGRSAGWSWFQDPRAVHFVGTHDKTYVGYVNSDGDIVILSYNHKSKGIDTFTLKSALQVDDHAAPSILIRNDGKLIAFYCAHNGSNIYYRISTNAEDISAWGVEQSISPQTHHDYPNPIQLSSESNRIHLFFRGGPSGHINKWYYVTSIDGGENWSASTTLIEIGAQTGYHQYLKIESNGVDKIYFTHSGHPANETPSIYFFYYYNGSYYKADATEILGGLPLDRDDMDLVYDASEGRHYDAWVYDIAISGTTYYIVFATIVSSADHRYNYARWTGVAWDVNEITTAGGELYANSYYSGGVSLDHEAPSTVYLSKVISAQWEIQKWRTPDGGSSWDTPVDVTSGSSKKNIRPAAIRNRASDLVLFWMWGDYNTYVNYDTMLMMDRTIK